MPSRITFTGDKTLVVRESPDNVAGILAGGGSGELHRPGNDGQQVHVFAGQVLYVEAFDPDRPLVAFVG